MFWSCFHYGQVNVNCSLPKSGFALGDTIPLTMEIENQSNKNIYIKASISRMELYDSGKGRTTTTSENNLAASYSRNIPPGATALLEEIAVIPRELPVSILHCPVISAGYFLAIQARSVVGYSQKMKIPILIANASPPPLDRRVVNEVLTTLLRRSFAAMSTQ